MGKEVARPEDGSAGEAASTERAVEAKASSAAVGLVSASTATQATQVTDGTAAAEESAVAVRGQAAAAARAPAKEVPATAAEGDALVAQAAAVDASAGDASAYSSDHRGSRAGHTRIRRAIPGSLRGSTRLSHHNSRTILAPGCTPTSNPLPCAARLAVAPPAVRGAREAPASSTDTACSPAAGCHFRTRKAPRNDHFRCAGSRHRVCHKNAGSGLLIDCTHRGKARLDSVVRAQWSP